MRMLHWKCKAVYIISPVFKVSRVLLGALAVGALQHVLVEALLCGLPGGVVVGADAELHPAAVVGRDLHLGVDHPALLATYGRAWVSDNSRGNHSKTLSGGQWSASLRFTT